MMDCHFANGFIWHSMHFLTTKLVNSVKSLNVDLGSDIETHVRAGRHKEIAKALLSRRLQSH